MQFGDKESLKQRNLGAFKWDSVLENLVSLRDDLIAQATYISKNEKVQERRSGRISIDRRREIDNKLWVADFVTRVIGRAVNEEIGGGPALLDEIDDSILKDSYLKDKSAILREAVRDSGYSGLGLHKGLVLLIREIGFGDTGIALDTLIDKLAEASKQRIISVEARRKEQGAHEDFHLAYQFFEELAPMLRKQAGYAKTRKKGLRGGIVYDLALDVANALEEKRVHSFVEPDAFGRNYSEVTLEFMRHSSYLAVESMVNENSRKLEIGSALAIVQQAFIDSRRDKEMKLEAYR